MPGLGMVMVEENHIWEVEVMVDDVGQVDHCLIAFIYGNCVRGAWVISYINVWFPVGVIG